MTDYRYEKKFYTDILTKEEVELLIKKAPPIFTERYYERRVNSIYFDSVNLESYFDNIAGSTEKFKARIRWYGELRPKAPSPTLEIKTKSGVVGAKHLVKLNDFDTDDINSEDLTEKIGDVPFVKGLIPVCLVSYMRKYFESAGNDFRMTMDTNFTYYKFDKYIHWNQPYKQNGIVLELKYKKENDLKTSGLSGFLLPRITRSSKYMNAMNSIYE